MLMSIAVLMISVVTIVLSTLNGSSFLAIFGLALAFWVVILLYVPPSKYVPLTLLNVSAEATVANIERLISELNLTERADELNNSLFILEEPDLFILTRARANAAGILLGFL